MHFICRSLRLALIPVHGGVVLGWQSPIEVEDGRKHHAAVPPECQRSHILPPKELPAGFPLVRTPQQSKSVSGLPTPVPVAIRVRRHASGKYRGRGAHGIERGEGG